MSISGMTDSKGQQQGGSAAGSGGRAGVPGRRGKPRAPAAGSGGLSAAASSLGAADVSAAQLAQHSSMAALAAGGAPGTALLLLEGHGSHHQLPQHYGHLGRLQPAAATRGAAPSAAKVLPSGLARRLRAAKLMALGPPPFQRRRERPPPSPTGKPRLMARASRLALVGHICPEAVSLAGQVTP